MHFVAFWFFIHAFQTFSYLYFTKLIDIFRQSNGHFTTQTLIDNKIESSDMTYFLLWSSLSGFIGLFVAFIISLIISIKRHWFWVNSLLTFVLTYILFRFDILGWIYFKRFFWYLGQRFSNMTIEFLFNGILLLIIGILIFFLRRTNKFIENKGLGSV